MSAAVTQPPQKQRENPDFKTLIIGGGGILGFAYLGALQLFLEHGHLRNVETYVGSSVGSLIAFLLICGYSPILMHEIISKVDFSDILDISVNDLMDFVDTFGVKDSGKMVKIIEIFARRKNISPDTTFAQLYKKTGKTFHVAVTCLSTRSVETFSHLNMPGMKVFDALRISIAIPFIFKPVILNGYYYIDGAIYSNCFCEISDTAIDKFPGPSLAFDVFCPHEDETWNKPLELWSYARHIYLGRLDFEHNKKIETFLKNKTMARDTTSSTTLNTSLIYIPLPMPIQFSGKFDMGEEEKTLLYFAGYDEAKRTFQDIHKFSFEKNDSFHSTGEKSTDKESIISSKIE